MENPRKDDMFKLHPHTPAHLFLDDSPYFITGAIYQRRCLLAAPELKDWVRHLIQKNFQAFGWELDEWVILDNHYHLIGMSRQGSDLPKIIKAIHGASASTIRQKTHCELPVWWNYWDYCPDGEDEYNTKLNYLLMNPIKHEYVSDLNDYPYSSFSSRLAKTGREELIKQFKTYKEPRYLKDIYDDF